MGIWRDAFHVEKAAAFVAGPREQELIDRFADAVCRRGLAVPAILFLETVRPLNFIGSQGLAFFEPLVRALFGWQGYADFRAMLARRGSIEALLAAVETAEAARDAARRARDAQ